MHYYRKYMERQLNKAGKKRFIVAIVKNGFEMATPTWIMVHERKNMYTYLYIEVNWQSRLQINGNK